MAKMEKTVAELDGILPEEPFYFREWAEGQIPMVPIYYRRNRHGAECWCGRCNQGYYTDDTPVRYGTGECRVCGHTGVYEWKKVTKPSWHTEYAVVVQRTTDNNLVIRHYEIYGRYQQMTEADIRITEKSRYFLMLGQAYRMEHKFYYGQTDTWEMVTYKSVYGGRLFPGYRTEINESNLKYCDIDALADCRRGTSANNGTDVSRMLITYANNPAVEMYSKSGMKKITSYILDGCGKRQFVNRKAGTPLKQLGITKKQLNRLREKDGDEYLLQAMQISKRKKLNWSEKEEEIARGIIELRGKKELEFFMQYMSLTKFNNRIEKYTKEKNGYGRFQTMGRYYDYLVMRKELGFDMANEIYLFPNNLIAKHGDMVRESNNRKDGFRIAKKNAEFDRIAERFEKLDKKYHHEAGGLFIRPAKNAGEIIDEGRILHHCVGSSDTYMRRHDKGESFILFLRHTEQPEQPYYTVELRKDGIISQWYSMNDQKPDKEFIEAWLKMWLETIRKTEKKEV